ncbi:hypothetical protein [Persicitalea sp.]|uniref:hypothetical protein n=1 Tax=Persicitalea sp. TaxID=3100273 RepID=UPI0035945D15
MPRRQNSGKLRFLAIAGILLITILLASTAILTFEFVYGNADGIWHDLNVIRTAFKTLVILSVVSLLLYGLIYGASFVKGTIGTLLVTALLLFGLEKLSLWLVNRNQPEPTTTTPSQPFLRPDHTEPSVFSDTLGVAAKPNWHIDWVPEYKATRYDTVTISTDSLGRRRTPLTDSLFRNRYAIFLGCSYTYGDGVSDNQTLPYYFQANSSSYRAYNYGFLAYSPLHALARLQQQDLERQIPQKDGFAVFTLIDDHLDRVIPATRWIDMTQGRFPYLNEETMTTDGVFADKRRVYTRTVLGFQPTGVRQLLKWSYPRVHTAAHYEWLVKIIAKVQQEYIARFNNENFFVVVFPGNPISLETRQLFEQANVKLLDYAKLIPIKENMLPFDSAHPAPVVYERVGQQLSKDIDSLLTKKREAEPMSASL